jgi:hypothetical protein
MKLTLVIYQYQSRRNAQYGRYLQTHTLYPTPYAERMYDQYRHYFDCVKGLQLNFRLSWNRHCFPDDTTVPLYPQGLSLWA